MSQQRTEVVMVPLYEVVENGALFGGLFCILSLYTWYFEDVILLNPLLAALWLFAMPFFYWMGRLMRKAGNDDDSDNITSG